MAKHMVKCFYCGQTFDANVEPWEKVNSRRYAHKACCSEKQNELTEAELSKQKTKDYIKKLFNYQTIPVKVSRQLQTYVAQNGYTYDGIYQALKYFFEIKGNSIEKANGGIGIVPYVYEESENYWKTLHEVQERNRAVPKEQLDIPVREVHIIPPAREPMKHTRRLFAFLEE